MNRVEDFLHAMKLGEIFKMQNEKKHSKLVMILAIVGAVVAIAAIAAGV